MNTMRFQECWYLAHLSSYPAALMSSMLVKSTFSLARYLPDSAPIQTVLERSIRTQGMRLNHFGSE
jgi:hypothetical protein